jgi:hypothetical protein
VLMRGQNGAQINRILNVKTPCAKRSGQKRNHNRLFQARKAD